MKTAPQQLEPAPDAVTLLKADHRKVEALFKEFEAADDKRSRGAVMQQICQELDIHAKIEEKILYPKGLKAKKAEDAVEEGFVEHEGIKRLVKQLKTLPPSDDFYDARAKCLKEYVQHHVKEEESTMFPKLAESGLDLKKIGAELQKMKARLQAASERKTTARKQASNAAGRNASATAHA